LEKKIFGVSKTVKFWGCYEDNILFRSNVLYHYRVYALLLAVSPLWGFHLSLLPLEEQTNKQKEANQENRDNE